MSLDSTSNLPQHNQTQGLAAAPKIEDIEIITLLGKGGMSLVYKARQKTLDRIVAVKVLSNTAFRGEDGIKRFQKEAKLTSTLDHPNIVKTISFGVSEDRQPYLVMEYLEGLSLADEFKQNGRLSLQKFKDVFLPTLSALNQAHRAGILHRDLKPGNIMICSAQNGEKTVKLVDFGIAKVIGEGETEAQNLTKSGALLGSPAYMSPEQCLGKNLDVRSDLYSMACVMYESLSGEPPFSGDSILEVMQKHSSAPPPTVTELSRKIDIRKELANVTLWGLAKDPATRPQTASEFAKKLNEVLESITLDKVPRLKKSEEKNFGTIAKLTIGAAVILPCIFMTAGLILISNKNMQKNQNASFNSMSMNSSQKEDLKYKRLLETPIVSLGMAHECEDQATRYQQQGNWERGEKLWKRAIALRQKLLKPNDLELIRSIDDLSSFYVKQGRRADAEPLMEQTLAIKEQILGSKNPGVIKFTSALAYCYEMNNKDAKAEQLFKRVLAIEEESLDKNDPRLVEHMEKLALCYLRQKKQALAEPLLKHTLAIKEMTLESNDAELSNTCDWLAGIYVNQRKYSNAEPLLKRLLLIKEKQFGENDPKVCPLLKRLGECYYIQGKFAQAEPLFKRLLTAEEKNPGTKIPTLTEDMKSLANCYLKQQKIVEANSLTERIKTLQSKTNH